MDRVELAVQVKVLIEPGDTHTLESLERVVFTASEHCDQHGVVLLMGTREGDYKTDAMCALKLLRMLARRIEALIREGG